MRRHTLSLPMPLRIGVYLMLMLSTLVSLVWGEALWNAFYSGNVPLWAPVLPPATFLAFMAVFFADRWLAVQHGRYPAARAMFQVGFAVLFFMLLLPPHSLQRRGQLPQAPAHAAYLEPTLLLLRHPDEDVRLAACDIVHGEVSPAVMAAIVQVAHNDGVARVREACDAAQRRLTARARADHLRP